MSEKVLNSRIVHKHDVEVNWLKATNFTPKQGEIIVYDIDGTYNYERLKIGDGISNVNDLPFYAGSWEDLSDKPFGKVEGKNYLVEETSIVLGESMGWTETYVPTTRPFSGFVEGQVYYVVFDGEVYPAQFDSDLDVVVVEPVNIEIYYGGNDEVTVCTASNDPRKGETHTFGMYTTELVMAQLDEQYIPDTIARVSDIEVHNTSETAHSDIRTSINDLSSLVGDKSVSSQISDAIANKADSDHTHEMSEITDLIDATVNHASTAASADKLTTPVTIDGVKFDGSTYITHYGLCDTDGTTSIKVVALSNFSLHTGSRVIVKFNKTNTVANPSLNVNNTGPVVIVHNGNKLSANSLVANGVYEFVFNGSHWALVGDLGVQVVDNLESTSATDALSANQGNLLSERIAENSGAISNLSTLVGDTSVSEQIEAANIIYVGPTQPTDPNIKVWINTAEDGTGVVPVLPRIATISLPVASWSGSSAPYSQVVEINTVTSATKIDLQPTVAQIVSLQNDDIALMAENIDGTVTIYSFGGKPSADMTMQVLLTEVSYV